MNKQEDRHKILRIHESGAAKRKAANAKLQKENAILSKTPRISDFLLAPTSSQNVDVNVNSTVIPDETCTDCVAPLDVINTIKNGEIEKDNQLLNRGLENDIGVWPDTMKINIDYWARNFDKRIQHCKDTQLLKEKSVGQPDGKKIRKCNISYFKRKTFVGEIIHRSWLCFSPKTGRVYCFYCKLFDESSSPFANNGFCDWKHGQERLISHETSTAHLNFFIRFNNLKEQIGIIDAQLQKQVESSRKYWRNVLKRVISVILFLSERSLAFRGENQIIGSSKNGNFLGIIELLSLYDPFLKDHLLKYKNCGSGKVNYLSSMIYEELIEEIGKIVQSEVVKRLKNAKFYSISTDGTKDRGHNDQLTIVFRYVENDKPVERFLKFLNNRGHKSIDMYNSITTILHEHSIDIKDCRSQSYDNASSMSGRFNGLQSLISKENHLAIWVPCFGHSLNLTAEKASEASKASTAYFMFLDGLFVFFTASDARWSLLIDTIKSSCAEHERARVPKRVDGTRWLSRGEANKSFVRSYTSIKETLFNIVENGKFDTKTQCEAEGYIKKMCSLEVGIMASFWNEILDNVNNTSTVLQSSKITINTATASLKSLRNFIAEKRSSFMHYECLGQKLTNISEYKHLRTRQRNVRLNPTDCQNSPEAKFEPSESFRIVEFIPLIDTFLSTLNQRISAYKEIESRFGFLSNFDQLNQSDISLNADRLLKIYKNDLDSNLEMELIQFREFYSNFLQSNSTSDVSREQAMYTLIIEKGVKESFPNVEILLRIFLTIMISNCTGERSFSKLNLIKNTLRTSMTENRLNYLTIISTERDIVSSIDMDNIIQRFVEKTSRKVVI